MALYPGATVTLLSREYAGYRALSVHNRMNLHVAVSLAATLFGYFNRAYKPSSHFYVLKSGQVLQYVDTSRAAEADLEGNDATISVETQGGVYDPQGEPWTAAQVESLAQLFAWAHKTHGIQMRLATDSKLGASSKGLSWHRLGIDGNFPASGILAGRLQRGGGMHYSTSRGKVCPGDAKIQQIPGILARAAQIAGGAVPVDNPVTPPPPAPKPKPTKPTTNGDYNMQTIDLRNAGAIPVRNADMGKLQALLMAHGYGPAGLVAKNGRPDGIGGKQTRYLFGAFQGRHPTTGTNGRPDYMCGDKSWRELIEG